MYNKEKQVRQLLSSTEQSLDFLRIIIDDLLLEVETLSENSKEKLFTAQRNYKIHKAILINIRQLISHQSYPLSKNLTFFIANNLRKRLSLISEEAIELDKER